MLCYIVVIYNKKLESSTSCRCLSRQTGRDFRVIVADNSEEDFHNREACATLGWEYIGSGVNMGLSKAYNMAISMIDDPDGYVCLLDDDTNIPESFTDAMLYNAKRSGADIVLPVAMQNNKILSPWKDTAFSFNRFFRSTEDCLRADTRRLLAFNSGMFVSAAVYKDIIYDEELFLDGVDISFLKAAKKAGKTTAVAPVTVEHSFSGISEENRDKALSRFKIYLSDSRVLYRDEPVKRFFVTAKRAARLSLCFKTSEPLRMVFRKAHRV